MKKLLSMALTFILAISLAPRLTTTSYSDILYGDTDGIIEEPQDMITAASSTITYYGDVNEDRRVDAEDVTYLRRYVARWTGYKFSYMGDVNDDGRVDAFDITHLRRYIANWLGYSVPPNLRNVSVRVLYEDSYYRNFNSLSRANDYVNQLFADAVFPYMYRWRIRLNPTPVRSAHSQSFYSATHGGTACTFVCANSPIYHPFGIICTSKHKCTLMLNYDSLFVDPIPSGSSYTLQTAIHTFEGCVRGYATIRGQYSTAQVQYSTNKESMAYIKSVRTIQHEISHNFGTWNNLERPCAHAICIMDEDNVYDEVKIFNLPTIWCSNCERDFTPNMFG